MFIAAWETGCVHSQNYEATHDDIDASQREDKDSQYSSWRTHGLSEMDAEEAEDVFIIHSLLALFPLPCRCPVGLQKNPQILERSTELQISK